MDHCTTKRSDGESTLSRIIRLSSELQTAFMDRASGGWLDDRRRGRIRDLCETLAALWAQRREEQAIARAGGKPGPIQGDGPHKTPRFGVRRGRAERRANQH